MWARRFDASGIALSDECLVHDAETGKQEKPAIAMSGAGELVVVWQAEDANDKGVFARWIPVD